ncbi:YpuI family protein [Peribacillus tepidiphilus]|uniref:YpuI family protein n=1 Tax=Peribacillus tepidiphilus TaxID=2652445 RepID=UPI001291BA5B|nr:YpuI family protein [Peribacillus tepidiphilus]
MGNSIVKTQLEDVAAFLTETVQSLEDFLNETTYTMLQQEKSGDEAYYKGLLSTLRRLLVHCEEGLDVSKIVLKNEVFHKAAAEKTLYKIYHQCIEEFFSPKNDQWYEDSRSAYTGRNSIKFHQEVPEKVSALIKKLESGFQTVREELEFYETDYRTKMIQSK